MKKVLQVRLQQIVVIWLNLIRFLSYGSHSESGNQYKVVQSHVWKLFCRLSCNVLAQYFCVPIFKMTCFEMALLFGGMVDQNE